MRYVDQRGFLVGYGGYSYVLNSANPVKSDKYSLLQKKAGVTNFMAFQGRTPCQELSALLELNKGAACDKMKWYLVLYQDSLTQEPAYYLKGGRAYKKETGQLSVEKVEL